MKKIFTIGHSNRKIEEFLEILLEFQIEYLVDIRSIPKSKRNPQFNEENIRERLKSIGIKYHHVKRLGGLRHAKKNSMNTAWKNPSFRGFADYMQTDEFQKGLEELKKIGGKNAAMMCAEALPWKCHRFLISDILSAQKIKVVHILSKTGMMDHKLNPMAKIKKKYIFYPN